MKKKIFTTIFFLSVLALSGCSSDNQNPSPDSSDKNGNNSEEQQDLDQGRDGQASTSTDDRDGGSDEDISNGEGQEQSGDTEGIKEWRTYSKDIKNVKIQYPGNWYYRRSLSQELDNDYYLYVEFAPTSKVLEGKATSSIELIGVSQDIDIEEKEYAVTARERNGRKFILRTGSKDKFQDIIDKMVTTFERID